jgi:hypothetical protein
LHSKRTEIPNDNDGGYLVIRELPKIKTANAYAAVMRSAGSGDSLEAELLKESLSQHIESWGNIFDENGKELPCNFANKIALLNDDELFGLVMNAVGEVEKEAEAKRGEAEKN